MFRSVHLSGFDQSPDWRSRVESALPIIADEVEKAADRIDLQFQFAPAGGAVEVELADDPYGRRTALWGRAVLDDEQQLRRHVRRLHMDILSDYLERQVDRWKAEAAEPVGA